MKMDILIVNINIKMKNMKENKLDTIKMEILDGNNNIKMEKYNIQTFIKKSNEIHNNKYDYTNIIWKNVGVKVSIKCNEHGNFEQTPSNHLMGKGCSYCSGVGRITKDIFLERAKKVHSEKYEYILNDDKITNTKEVQIKCKIHGIFLQTPKNHLKGQCCPKCSKYYKYNQ